MASTSLASHYVLAMLSRVPKLQYGGTPHLSASLGKHIWITMYGEHVVAPGRKWPTSRFPQVLSKAEFG